MRIAYLPGKCMGVILPPGGVHKARLHLVSMLPGEYLGSHLCSRTALEYTP
jgi:hypothetical protein